MTHGTEPLTSQGQRVLDHWRRIELPSFYLAGGTGLALQLRHRISVDFDFFSRDCRLEFHDRQGIKETLASSGVPFQVQKEKDRTLMLRIERVIVSFFHYPYPLLGKLVQVSDLPVASVEDIGAMKLSAIVSRGSRRDFIDVYEIAQRLPLKTLLQLAARKFVEVKDFAFQAVKALAYFEEAEAEPMPRLLKPVDWGQVRSFFEQEVTRLSHEWLEQ